MWDILAWRLVKKSVMHLYLTLWARAKRCRTWKISWLVGWWLPFIKRFLYTFLKLGPSSKERRTQTIPAVFSFRLDHRSWVLRLQKWLQPLPASWPGVWKDGKCKQQSDVLFFCMVLVSVMIRVRQIKDIFRGNFWNGETSFEPGFLKAGGTIF